VPLPPAWLVLVLVLVGSFALKLRNLDHTALTRWDEVFHAVVAQNVLKHPFKPTLVDVPYLPYDYKKWGENHVWLHKPILPFWQIAMSFAVLGIDTFALRFPSAVLSTAACWLTYLIGKELLDRRAGLIAAMLQAVNPFVLQLVHGYQFADAIDVALLFWVEVGVYFLVRSLRTGSWRDVLLAGLAQGLAFLCKSYLAFIIFGIALTAWLLPVCRLARRDNLRIGPFRLLALLGMTVLTAGPWLLYCLSNYPDEFWQEDGQIWLHLGANVEGWGAPWDRVAFDYLIRMYDVFYTPMLVALVVLLGKAVARQQRGLWLLCAWGLGVLLPHLFATSKTPSATLIGMPALLLLLGYLVALASRGERWSLAALLAVLVLSVLVPAAGNPGHGYPSSRAFGAVMRHALWVVGHVAGAVAFTIVVAIVWLLSHRQFARAGGALGFGIRMAAWLGCLGILAWLGWQTVRSAWRITDMDRNETWCADVGQFAREQLPANAVLLCEERQDYEHLMAMFYADRTCYALPWQGPDEIADRIVQAGGIPYVVTYRRLPLAAVHVSGRAGPTVYRWQPRGN
jgi:4-amino-4-deoxy-L-arabinose transferase